MRQAVIVVLGVWLASCSPSFGARSGLPAPRRGDATRGRQLFEYTCEACHYAASTVARAGPGLAGLYQMPRLRNGAAVTDANVQRFIRNGTGLMPGYRAKITPEQMRDLIAYLRSL